MLSLGATRFATYAKARLIYNNRSPESLPHDAHNVMFDADADFRDIAAITLLLPLPVFDAAMLLFLIHAI